MGILDYFLVFVISGAVFLAFDLLWLGVIARDFYRKQLKKIRADRPSLPYSAVFYAVFLIGMMFFALVPAINEGSLGIAMGRGAAYGFFTYATWGLTNAAVVKGWPNKLVSIDLAWGTFLSFVTATAAYSIYTGLVA